MPYRESRETAEEKQWREMCESDATIYSAAKKSHHNLNNGGIIERMIALPILEVVIGRCARIEDLKTKLAAAHARIAELESK